MTERHPMQQLSTKAAPAISVVMALALFCLASSRAQTFPPPVNDSCSGALVVPALTLANPVYLTPLVEVFNATTNDDPVLPEGAIGVTRSVWYRFTPNSSALYTISLGPDTATTVNDTVLAMYTSPSGCGGPFTLFNWNDDSASLRAGISTNLAANTAYYIVAWVGLANAETNPPVNIQLRVSRPTKPINDSCAGAELIPTSAAFPYLTSTNDTTLATETNDPPVGCHSSGDLIGVRSVWFRFSPPETGTYVFSTGSDTATTVNDTALEIFRSGDLCNGPYTSVVCNENGVGRAIVSTSLTNNVTYYILVWDQSFEPILGAQPEYISGETLVQLRVSRPIAPTVRTLGASSISSTGAVLSAAINPNSALTRFWFEWGTSTAYTATSAVRLLLASTTTTTSSVPIGGTSPNTTIHYRVVATSSVGRSNGLDQTFIWRGTQPVLTSPGSLVAGTYGFSFTNFPQHLCLVERSTNLIDWTSQGPAQEISPGQFRFHQTGAATLPSRFYRIRLP